MPHWNASAASAREHRLAECVEVEHRGNSDKETARAAKEGRRNAGIEDVLGDTMDEGITCNDGWHGENNECGQAQDGVPGKADDGDHQCDGKQGGGGRGDT